MSITSQVAAEQMSYKKMSKNKKKKLIKVVFDQRTTPETADWFIADQPLKYTYNVTLENSGNLYRADYGIPLRGNGTPYQNEDVGNPRFGKVVGNVWDGRRIVGKQKLTSSGGDDKLYGGLGNDVIRGKAGSDYIAGNKGNDKLYGGANHDEIWGGAGKDTLYGNNGKDVLFGNSGKDKLYGGKGSDCLDGGKGRDTLYGGKGGDHFEGGLGADRLYGGKGNDTMYGGNVTYWVGPPEKKTQIETFHIWGLVNWNGPIATYSAEPTPHSVWSPDDKNDTLFGGVGHDYLCGGFGNDVLKGGTGRDSLFGEVGNDKLYGGNGNDLLYGDILEDKSSRYRDLMNGNDKLYGGRGNDTLYGGAGNDVLNGGTGKNLIVGGAGKDKFQLVLSKKTLSTIEDFNRDEKDKLILDIKKFKHLKFNKKGQLDKSQFVANKRGRAIDKDDYIVYNAKTGMLYYDADGRGKGAAVKIAKLTNKAKVKASDFLVQKF